MSNAEKDPSGDGGEQRPASEDLVATAHLHHSPIDQEAIEHPDWLPAKIPEAIGAGVVLLLALGVGLGAVLRYAGHGVLGLVELASLAMLVVVVLGAAGLSYRDEHVRLELIDGALGEKNVGRLELFVDAVMLLVTLVVIYSLFSVFRLDLSFGTTLSGELGIPRKWVSGVAVICFLLVGIVLVRKTIADVRAVRRGEH